MRKTLTTQVMEILYILHGEFSDCKNFIPPIEKSDLTARIQSHL